MPAGRFSRNTVLAGVFVLAVVALLVAGIVLTGFGKTKYVVEFTLQDGADGLEKGSKVKLGGRQIGNVKSIEFHPAPKERKPIESLLVTIEVDSTLELYENADVSLVRPLLGSNSTLNFVNLRGGGVAAADAKVVAPGGKIRGKLGPPAFLPQADYARVQAIVASVEHWITDIDKDWPKPYDEVKAIVSNVNSATKDIKELAATANGKAGGWTKQLDDLLAEANARFKKFTDQADVGIEKARATVERIQKIVEDNQPRIDAAMKSAADLVEKLNGRAYADLIDILERGKAVMASAQETARQAQAWVTTQTPKLSDIVEQALLASLELKLATSEVRAAPWRLLYQPNKKELENELLYNTMRAYSQSLADVRGASESLRAASQALAATPAGAQPAFDQAALDQITARLQKAVADSQAHEQKLYDLWARQSPGPPPPGSKQRREP